MTSIAHSALTSAPVSRTLARFRLSVATVALAAVFVVNLAYTAKVFFPTLKDIGVWDESLYVEQGRDLMRGILPSFSTQPAMSLLYAMTYLPVHSSPFWLVYSCSIARLILFTLLWFAAILAATELNEPNGRFIMAGFLLVSPALMFLVSNGADALFAAMSGFALFQFLRFLRTHAVRHLWICSGFLGVAALSRSEGPVLFLVFLGLSLVACWRTSLVKKASAACLVPFISLTGGYILFHGIVTGDFKTGNMERSYLAFEQGQGVAFAEKYTGKAYYVQGQSEARRLFGTPEENRYSVFRAISRNPKAYVSRILPLSRHVIWDAVTGYGWYLGILVVAFAIRGVVHLIRQRQLLLLASIVLWSAYVILYVLLVSQPSHILVPFVSFFLLAIIGVSAFVSNLNSKFERNVWLGLAALMIAIAVTTRGISSNGPLFAALIIFGGLLTAWTCATQIPSSHGPAASLCLLTLLSVGLILRSLPGTGSPNASSLADEQAAIYLKANFPEETRMAAYGPGRIFNAKMFPVTTNNIESEVSSGEQLSTWIDREKVRAIYVDQYLREYQPSLWSAIQTEIGSGLKVAFNSTDNSVQVLVPDSARLSR